MKSLWNRFLEWFDMEPERPPVAPVVVTALGPVPAVASEEVVPPAPPASAAYLDLGVEDETVGSEPTYMVRAYSKVKKGVYRFDGDTGTYHFSKQDAGRKVVLFFIDHGQPRRLVRTIGL